MTLYLLMMLYFSLLMTILSTLIVIMNPSSPFTAWLGLELNSFSFIPLMKNNNNLASHESMIKYFLIQSITSILFLTPTLLLNQYTYNYPMSLNTLILALLSISLLTKMGAAPTHFWMFPLINSISWLSFTLLMTWQKIAPLLMLTFLLSKIIIFSIIFSAIMPPLMSMNQNATKMIFGYASITHMAWLLSIIMTNTPLLYLYLLLYMMNFIPILLILSYWNLIHLTQITSTPNNQKYFLFFITLSLSGFPPLMMFMIKIMLMFQLIQNHSMYFITLLLLTSSLMLTYSYIYMNFPLLMKTSPSSSKIFSPKPFFILPLIMTPTLFIPIITMMM